MIIKLLWGVLTAAFFVRAKLKRAANSAALVYVNYICICTKIKILV